jgi:hypothetical protein
MAVVNQYKFKGIDNSTTGSALTPLGTGNPFGKFFSKEESEKLIKEYNDKMKTKKAGGGIVSLL